MKVPYARQTIDQNDINAVIDVLRSSHLTQGPSVSRFERGLCELTGASHACVVNSASSALQLAYQSLGLTKDDYLWTTPNTFVATANAAIHCGAKVDFVDIEPKSHNICMKALEQKLEQAAILDCLPKIVVPVHFAGRVCDMKKLHSLAKKWSFKVVEDASHALGAFDNNIPVGACQFSDLTVFSFHAIKIITSGEGGAVLTNSPSLAKQVQMLRSHGVTKDPAEFQTEQAGPWHWEQKMLGYNYRMSDIQAALGSSQLKKTHEFVKQRQKLAQRYEELLSDLPLSLPPLDSHSSWHLYVVQLPAELESQARSRLFNVFEEHNIGLQVHYMPIYRHPFYQQFQLGECRNAELYYQHCVSLPIHCDLSEIDQKRIAILLTDFLELELCVTRDKFELASQARGN